MKHKFKAHNLDRDEMLDKAFPKKETTPTTEQYIEPRGFKGSKGKWYVQPPKKHIFPIVVLGGSKKIFIPTVCINETDTRNKGSFEATAQLISQSKELAKALQDILNNVENCNVDEDYYVSKKLIKQAAKVLKEAGLSE